MNATTPVTAKPAALTPKQRMDAQDDRETRCLECRHAAGYGQDLGRCGDCDELAEEAAAAAPAPAHAVEAEAPPPAAEGGVA